MEKFEARTALKKSSFLSEIAMVTREQVCFEDVRTIANVTCEEFSVDDLLDFSDKDFEEGSFQESEEDETKDSFFESLNHEKGFNYSLSDANLSNNENDVVFGHLPSGGLSVSVDEMENLEWLSQIVDDSPTAVSLLCPVSNFNWNTGSFLKNRLEPVSRPDVHRVKEPCFPLPACKKPRGKRPRPNGRAIREIGLSPSVTPESSLTSSSLDGSSRVSTLLFAFPVRKGDWVFSGKPVAKKQKKEDAEANGSNGSISGGTQTVRKCTHCQVQKTPQWRAGPLGPKTLCNACGVRFKSGRLFPEYRPACSPTFSQEAHSNSHRKVLEMRRKKEVVGVIETGLSPMVQSF